MILDRSNESARPAVAAAPTDTTGKREHAPIRSFVLRQGRITPAQERAFAIHWSRYGCEYRCSVRDFDEEFRRSAPRIVEVGFGNGEALHASAGAQPERDFIGIEVHRPGVGRLLNAAAHDGIDNLRVYRHDAVEVLREEFAPASIATIRVWFPDPWPKLRHQKRRLVQSDFVALVASRLIDGGVLHLATDWEGYAEQMRNVVRDEPSLAFEEGSRDGFAPDPAERASTHFERRGRKLGHGVWDIIAIRTNRVSRPA